MPKVSIVLSTFNRVHLIDRAIESVLEQTFSLPDGGWELIIVDDASTDNTEEIVKQLIYRSPTSINIIYSKAAENIGIARNSNRGLRMAKGEYIAIIDDDDRWIDRDKLVKQVEFLDKNPDHVAVGGGIIVVDKDGKEMFRYLKPETDVQIRNKMLFDNTMANSTTVFRRSVAEKVGLYDESLRYSADRDFFLKLGLEGKLYNFPEYFANYTMAGQNTSIVKMKEHLRSSLMVMKRYKNNYPHYPLALIVNRIQYAYAFLPNFLKRFLHIFLARLKRALF
ncbi:MAG: glycosyltransferase [Patescibacteria group bacterium]